MVIVPPSHQRVSTSPEPEKPQVAKDLSPPIKREGRKKRPKDVPDRFKSKPGLPGPGPTSYQQDLSKKITDSMPNFSFGYKFGAEPIIKEKIDPAEIKNQPGVYYPQYLHRELGRSISFTKSKRDGPNQALESAAQVPASQFVYIEPEKVSSRKGTFGFGKRSEINHVVVSCFPKTDYNVDQHTLEYQARKIQRRAEQLGSSPNLAKSQSGTKLVHERGSESMNVPYTYGLAQKDPKSPDKRKVMKGWSFGSPKKEREPDDRDKNLGPGEYYNNESNPQKFPPVKSLSKLPLAKRKPLSDATTTPGPGTYPKPPDEKDERVQEFMEKGGKLMKKGYTFRQKLEPHGIKDIYRQPGPGEYQYDHIYGFGWNSHKGFKFGTSERPPVNGEKVSQEEDGKVRLGPGVYHVNRDLGSEAGIKFPKSKRRPMGNDNDDNIDVGPGKYNLLSTVPQLQPHEQARLNQIEGLNLNLP